jgi:hypothetical protein
MNKQQYDLAIERLVDQALAEKVVKYNRYGVGSFSLDPSLLPADLPTDRYGCYDSFICSGNGCAQTRNKGGRCYITFNIEPEFEFDGKQY